MQKNSKHTAKNGKPAVLTPQRQNNEMSFLSMKTVEFDYTLPDELIAQAPAIPRDSCRLMVLHRKGGQLEHRVFSDILEYLCPTDLLVVNDTKVLPARLMGMKKPIHTKHFGNTKQPVGAARPASTPAELLLLHKTTIPGTHCAAQDSTESALPNNTHIEYWEALVKPGRRLKPGSIIHFEGMQAEIVDWVEKNGKGRRIVRLTTTAFASVEEAIQKLGVLPLPPYITQYTGEDSWYQTVYAREQNSAAAPTAGLHFSKELLERAAGQVQGIARVNLEIGLDTFRTVEEEDIAEHKIHSEYYSVSAKTARAVQETKERGGRVIAVGTTAVRALESAAALTGMVEPVCREQTRLYITPGYSYRVVDALLTNFHTPRSTLLMLVSAFTGHAAMCRAYQTAIEERYRFLSFGDALFIV